MKKEDFFVQLSKLVMSNRLTRSIVAKQIDRLLYKTMVTDETKYSKEVRLDRYYGMKSLLVTAMKNINRGLISKQFAGRAMETLIKGAMIGSDERVRIMGEFKKKYGIDPPGLVVISPTKKCNLKCIGCYASSTADNSETLEWSLIDKMMHEFHDEMGMRFFVISGGEPLMYSSEGKTILDLPRAWPDSFFLMYTNGTLITKEVAKTMAELGNLTPAVSVEGFKEETDTRRGAGIHERTLQSLNNLREAKVPFGISVTATKKNAKLLTENKFYDYYFGELGASYMWMFQYMPIGREFTTDLMLSPTERFDLYKKWRDLIHKEHWFVADFWNSAEMCDGCISCGKGYFYIDWNANIMPCVFIPYYQDNARDLVAKNKKIADALFSDFFTKGREWQENYLKKESPGANLLRPCLIRDHHKEFMEIARSCNILPEDEAAKAAMEDEGYHEKLYAFDKELKEIADPYWNEVLAKKD
ncbi:MAG: radical SAM protein [Patescibacteria group bacterium]